MVRPQTVGTSSHTQHAPAVEQEGQHQCLPLALGDKEHAPYTQTSDDEGGPHIDVQDIASLVVVDDVVNRLLDETHPGGYDSSNSTGQVERMLEIDIHGP